MNRLPDSNHCLLTNISMIADIDSGSMRMNMRTANNTLSQPNVIDYGYEEHQPSPKRHYEPKKIVSSSTCATDRLNLLLASSSSSYLLAGSAVEVDDMQQLHECDFPPIPADRQARKQRSFHRRGGEGHGALLRAAVMASMMDATVEEYSDNDETHNPHQHPRRSGRNSDISLQSLQEALSETTSPRKRARHTAGARRSFSSLELESEEEEMNNPEEIKDDDDQDHDEEEEQDILQFSGHEQEDEEDEQILQASADLGTLVMNNTNHNSSSLTMLRTGSNKAKNHHRSYSGNLRLTSSSALLLNSSISSLPNIRSYSIGSRPRRWVSRRTSYDSWASAPSDYSFEEEDVVDDDDDDDDDNATIQRM